MLPAAGALKRNEASKDVWQSTQTEIAGQAPMSGAMDMAMVTNSMVHCPRPRGEVAADGGSKEEEMEDVEEEEAIGEARDVMMTET